MTDSTARRALPKATEMEAYLDKFVRSQSKAKRDLAVAVYNHYASVAYQSGSPKDVSDFGKQHLLIMGPTGCGKTYMVKLLAKMLGLPCSSVSATSMVRTGIVGLSAEQMLHTQYMNAGRNLDAAQRGIIFIDEIDKIRIGASRAEDESGGEVVQNGLLTLMDGARVKITEDGTHASSPLQFDTSNLLFVCTGAFTDLPNIVRARLTSAKRIGFRSASTGLGGEGLSDDDALAVVEPVDLFEYGFIWEFIGRFPGISSVRSLSEDDLIEILIHGEGSILRKQKRLFELHGITLEFTEEALRCIARQAIEMGTGARALDRLVLQSLDAVDYRLPDLAEDGVYAITITEQAVVHPGEMPELARASSPIPPDKNQSQGLRERVMEVLSTGATNSDPFDVGSGCDPDRIDSDMLCKIETLRLQIPHEEPLDPGAELWWTRLLKDPTARPALVLELVRELAKRQAPVSELYAAALRCEATNMAAVLHFLDYLRTKDQTAARDRRADPDATQHDREDEGSTGRLRALRAKGLRPGNAVKESGAGGEDPGTRPESGPPHPRSQLLVRCPLCRSLVPAGPRCRMCGKAPLSEVSGDDGKN